MFKYKQTAIVLGIIACFLLAFLYMIIKSGKEEIIKESNLLKNNVSFSGIISNLKVSGNHSFGIVEVKVIQKNRSFFQAFSDDIVFPYAINNSVAEVYTRIPIPEIKKGYVVFVDSDNKIIKFYDRNKFLYEWDIFMIEESIDVEFIKENTRFKENK